VSQTSSRSTDSINQNETPQNITPEQDETPVRGKTTMPLAQEENLPDLDKLLANDTNHKYENHKANANDSLDSENAFGFLEAFLAATADSIIKGRNMHPDVLHARGLVMTDEENRLFDMEEKREEREKQERADIKQEKQYAESDTSPTSPPLKTFQDPVDPTYGFADRSLKEEPPITIITAGVPQATAAEPDMSKYLKATLPGVASPPSLRDIDFFNQNLGPNARLDIGPDMNLRSAYFQSTPVGDEGERSVDYTRLAYSEKDIKRKDETVYGGVIGGLAGVFGIILSKKVIFTFVGLATLIALGITGTSPHEIMMNLLSNFGIGWDLSINMQTEQDDGNTQALEFQKSISEDAMEYNFSKVGRAVKSPFWNSLIMKTLTDLAVGFNADYFGNSLAVTTEGGKSSDAVLNVSFKPSEETEE